MVRSGKHPPAPAPSIYKGIITKMMIKLLSLVIKYTVLGFQHHWIPFLYIFLH